MKNIDREFWGTQQEPWAHGYSIYLVQEDDSGPIKVGVASHPLRRLSALQGGNHRLLTLRAIYTGTRGDCWWLEKIIHARFKTRRADRGEWFNVQLWEVLAEMNLFAEGV